MIKDFLIKHGRLYRLIFLTQIVIPAKAVIHYMKKYCWKLFPSIKIITFALFVLLLSGIPDTASAQSLEDSIDDERISVGESTTIRHKISGADGDIKPVSVPAVPGLRIDYSGMQKSFQFVNGKTWSGIIFTFIVSADKPGKYKIPRFIYDIGGKQVSTRELQLAVANGSSTRPGRTGAGVPARLDTAVEAASRRVYTGEPVIFRYYLFSSGLRNLKFVNRENQADAKGFVVKEYKEDIEDISMDDGTVKYHLYTLVMIPAQAGNHEAGGGNSIISFDVDSMFFGIEKRPVRVSFVNIPISVIPLPKSPTDFKGAVGDFKITAEYSKDAVKAYDEKKINIIIKGKGNLVSLTKPDFENQVHGIKVLTEEAQPEITLKGIEITGEKKFIFTVIPEKQGELNLGPVTFTFFNPARGEYVKLKTEDISFNVTEGGKARASSELDAEGSEKIVFNYIYIVIIFLLVGGIGAGVFYWEKKREVKISPEKKIKEPEVIKQDTESKIDFVREMSSSMFRMDKRAFLSASDNALSEIARTNAGVSSEEISKFKDEIYLYRFGGGDLTQKKMEEILEKMNLLKVLIYK